MHMEKGEVALYQISVLEGMFWGKRFKKIPTSEQKLGLFTK